MGLDDDHALDIHQRIQAGDATALGEAWMKRICYNCDFVVYESYMKYLTKQARDWAR